MPVQYRPTLLHLYLFAIFILHGDFASDSARLRQQGFWRTGEIRGPGPTRWRSTVQAAETTAVPTLNQTIIL